MEKNSMKLYKVTLTEEEIEELKIITNKGKKNALILLNVDQSKSGKAKKGTFRSGINN